MNSPPKPLDILQAGDQDSWTDSSVDKQPSSPPANPSLKPEQPLTPHESTSPALPKSQADDAETTSSLSPAPSPLTTHRPTSSKTSIDDQPLTPLDSPEKASQSTKDPPESVPEAPKEPEQDAEDKAEAQPLKQPSPTPVEKPVETPKIALPEDKVSTILQLNAELLNVYNEFHTQDQVLALPNELQQYSIRIHANVQWLMQYKETLGTQFASRISLQIISPPPPVPFISTESINALYAHLNSLFEKENARAQRKQQLRQMMLAGSGIPMAGVSASSPINVNANGKRERTEDDQPGSEVTGDHSPRKRVDTGESKTTPGMPNTNTPSPVSMHASPSRMNASPSHMNASTNPNPAPGAPGGPLRPSSSQSNSSSHANTAQAPMAPPPTFPGGAGGAVNGVQGMMGQQQQLDRMRMIQQQNRMRAMGGDGGSNGSPQTMMNGGGGGVPQPQNQNPPAQQGQNQNINPNIAAQISGLGIAPRPVPPTILPQLMTMIQNPQMHTSVQLLHSKIPGFRTMPVEQQAGVLWAFQQNQMRQQQEMQQRQMQQHQQMQQMQQNMQGQGGGQMPGQMQGQNQMQQHGMQNGYPQNGAMGMGGMRPNSAGSMQPPPSPHLIQQQRQLNLMQQQQQATMGRGPSPGMAAGGYPGGVMNPGMGMGMGGVNIGGHARMPSNPTMGPPPVPGSISTPQSMYPQGMNGMNQYQPGSVNPMNLSYPMQPQIQHQQPQQHQQQPYGMHHQSPSMAGSPPNSASSTAWSPMSGSGGQPLTPAAIMQQQQAKMGGMSPSPGPGGGGGGLGSIDPNSLVNWQDLEAT